MNTKIELNGFVIEIEEIDGVINVTAEKDDEVIEEFSIDTNEDNYGEEEDDFDQGQSQAQSQGQSQAQSQAQSQGQSQAQSQGQSQGQPQGQSQGQPQGQSQGQPQAQSQGQRRAQPDMLESFESFLQKQKK